MEDVVTNVITQWDHSIVAVTLDISLVLTEKAVMVGATCQYIHMSVSYTHLTLPTNREV